MNVQFPRGQDSHLFVIVFVVVFYSGKEIWPA